MGGRHGTDPTMVGTSIALLQERFRQLQKDKQRREKKELLDLLSDSNRIAASTNLESENLLTSRHEDSLSLGLNVQNAGKRAHSHEARLMPPLTMLWPDNAAVASASRNFDNQDVDTTLHL